MLVHVCVYPGRLPHCLPPDITWTQQHSPRPARVRANTLKSIQVYLQFFSLFLFFILPLPSAASSPPLFLGRALTRREECMVFANLPSVMTRHARTCRQLGDAAERAHTAVVLMLGRRGGCLATESCGCRSQKKNSASSCSGGSP